MLQNAPPNTAPLSESQTILFVALAMLGGCVLYYALTFEPSLILVMVAFTVSLICVVALRARTTSGGALRFCVLLCLGMSAGLCLGKFASLRTSTVVIAPTTSPVLIEGWLERVDAGRKGQRVVLRLHAVAGAAPLKTPQHIRLTHRASLKVEPGRFVRCWAMMRSPPKPVIPGDYAFHRQAWHEGLSAVGYVQGRCRGGVLDLPHARSADLHLRLQIMRRAMARFINHAAGERAGSLAVALMTGDRSFMSVADIDALRAAGLAHLVAISGLHVGIVGGLVYLIIWRGLALIEPLALRYTVRKPAALCAMTACAAYLIVSGASVTTQRAFIMACIFFGAVLIDRTALSHRSFAVAMIVVLILAPWSALTPGFQMSFAATGALIATYEAWRRRRQRLQQTHKGLAPVFWVKSLIVTSVVSSLATLPFALYHFDRFAAFGVIANLFAMPIISLLSAPLAALTLMASVFGWASHPLHLFGKSLEAILWIAHWTSNLPHAHETSNLKLPDQTLWLWTLALICMCFMGHGRRRVLLGSGLCLLGCLFWYWPKHPQLHWAPNNTLYMVTPGEVTAHSLGSGDGLAPLRYVDLANTPICAAQHSCEIDLEPDLTLLHLSSEAKISCHTLQTYDLVLSQAEYIPCPDLTETLWITERQMQKANGLTVRLTPKGPQLDREVCAERPWSACP